MLNSGDPNLEFDFGYFTNTNIYGNALVITLNSALANLEMQGLLDDLQDGDSIYVDTTVSSQAVKYRYIFDGERSWTAIPATSYIHYLVPIKNEYPIADASILNSLAVADSNVTFGYAQTPTGFYTTEADSDEYQRWQFSSLAYGLKAGTGASIKAAAQLVLTGDKRVALLPGYGDNPFVIEIRTIDVETPDADPVTTTSKTVLAAVEPSRPAGYAFIHTTTDEFYLTLGSQGLGILGQSVLD
jgi:hypothetical protein